MGLQRSGPGQESQGFFRRDHEKAPRECVCSRLAQLQGREGSGTPSRGMGMGSGRELRVALPPRAGPSGAAGQWTAVDAGRRGAAVFRVPSAVRTMTPGGRGRDVSLSPKTATSAPVLSLYMLCPSPRQTISSVEAVRRFTHCDFTPTPEIF